MNHNIYTITQKIAKPPKNNMSRRVYDVNTNISTTDYNICLANCLKERVHIIMNHKWQMYDYLVKNLGKTITDSIVPETTLLREYLKKDKIPYPFYLKHPGKARKEAVYFIKNYDDMKPYIDNPSYVCQKPIISDKILGNPYNLRLYIFITKKNAYLYKDGIIKIGKSDDKIIIDCEKVKFSSHEKYDILFPKIKEMMSIVMKVFTTYANYEYKPDYKILLFGVDVMIDINDRPWLIEINSGPQMENDNLLGLRMNLLSDCIHFS